MKLLAKIMMLVSPILMLLNAFGGIVGGVWLAFLGQWGIIGYGIAYLFFGAFALALALMPSAIFYGPAALCEIKGLKVGTYFFAFLGSAYIMIALSAWCLWVMYFFVQMSDPKSLIPILLWSYGAATGPLAYMAQKEAQTGNGDSSFMATFFAQLAYFIAALAVLFSRPSIEEVGIIFLSVMMIHLVFATVVAVQLSQNRST